MGHRRGDRKFHFHALGKLFQRLVLRQIETFQQFFIEGQALLQHLLVKGESGGVELRRVAHAEEEEHPRHLLLIEGEVLRGKGRLV